MMLDCMDIRVPTCLYRIPNRLYCVCFHSDSFGSTVFERMCVTGLLKQTDSFQKAGYAQKMAMIMCFTIGLKDAARFQSSGYAHDVYSCQHPALRLFMYLNVISMTGFDFG